MFSVADLLDRAKEKANIESDYRLSKILRIKPSAISNYRAGRTPNVEILEALCALSGDDAGLIVAQAEALKAEEGPVKTMWLNMAKRLQGAATSAILAALFAIGLIAAPAQSARAGEVVESQKVELAQFIHRMK